MPVYRSGNSFSDTPQGGAYKIRPSGARTVENLRRLVTVKPRGTGRLAGAQNPDPIAASRGVATPEETTGDSGGIDSPLTENNNAREYHAARDLASADGLFVFEHRPIAKVKFQDKSARLVEVYFDDPDV